MTKAKIAETGPYDLASYIDNLKQGKVTGAAEGRINFSAVSAEKFWQLFYPTKSLYEQKLYQAGARLIAGVDEVGRGCLAGPLVVAAVILPLDFTCPANLDDSKKLTAKKREDLAAQIKKAAVAYHIETASVEEIATYNILEADKRAMIRALKALSPQPDAVIADYVDLSFKTKYKSEHPAKGDSLSYSVAAASILAKVYRDQLMTELAQQYPEYLWQKNKGYGTKEHYEALDQYGPTIWHRELFLRKWKEKKQPE